MGDRQAFIGNLCNVTIEALRTYCEKYGSLTDLSLNRDKDNNVYHCFAFVTFQLSRCLSQFMSKRPHVINGEHVFVKRALPRFTASIPERLVVTNRLVLSDSKKYQKKILRTYFEKFGHIKKFDYENGFIDFDDYDDVDRILLARPHYIEDEEIFVTKIVPTEEQINGDVDEPFDQIIKTSMASRIRFPDEEEDLSVKYEHLKKQFSEYKMANEKELISLRKELKHTKEDLSDITQIKLDKLLKNQQLFHNELLFRLFPNDNSTHAQMCEDFLRSTPNKKRKQSTSLTDNDDEYDHP